MEVIQTQPYFNSVAGTQKKSCSYCGLDGRVRCSVCKSWYCARTCQADHWPLHRRECLPLPQLEMPDGSAYLDQYESKPMLKDRIAGTETLDAPLDHPREQGEDRTNLIINYLPQAMTDNELYSMFITVGQIVTAKIMRDKSSGYSYGYGFVHYQNPEDASKAIATLNGLQVSNKRIKVSYSRPNTADIKDTNLYVGNVPPGITEEALQSLFAPFGSILTFKLLKDQTGKVKGIAFIRFSKKAEADDAIANLHGYQFPGSNRGLDVKVAEDHGRQKAAFYAGWMVGQGASDDGGSDWGDGYEDSNYGYGQGFPRGGRGGRGFGGRGAASGGFNSGGFGLQAFPAPGSGMRGGMGGNRFNPMSRGGNRGAINNTFPGNNGNVKGGAFGAGAGFQRGTFGAPRGMPARGGGGNFMRGGGARGTGHFAGAYGGPTESSFGGGTWS